MEDVDRARIADYFRDINAAVKTDSRPAALVVTHLLPERPLFIDAIAGLASVCAVLPKPKSIDATVLAEVSGRFACDDLDRHRLADPDEAVAYLEKRAAGRPVVLMDIGGYFAPALSETCARFSGQVLGVIEDTENGLQRYLGLGDLPCPVYSVARSPLKEPEDYLVGQSVAFSIEALLRSRGDILHGRRVSVLGFGKVGASVATMLDARRVQVTIFDIDPVRMVQAIARGFRTAPSRSEALSHADVVIAATGHLALRSDDFDRLPSGAYIASVTSSDDELELAGLDGRYAHHDVWPHITRYSSAEHHFYVLNDGNAVNFLHGAAVGLFIFLVQGELLAALARLAAEPHDPGLYEVPAETRELIANSWLRHFNRTHASNE